MDKPLKYFLLVSAVFVFFIGIFALATFTKKPFIPKEYVVVDETDALIMKARARARISMDTFFSIYRLHPDSAFVRFSFEPTRDHIEHLWGKVTELDSAHLKIQLKRKEGLEDIYYPDELELGIDRIEDWMIHPPGEKIKGGFTAQAILWMEKEKPYINGDSIQLLLTEFADRIK